MAYRATERTRTAAQKRRGLLLEESARLVASGGFAAAKVKTIADRCEVGVGTVYSYFESRSDLLAEVFRVAACRELAVVGDAVRNAGPGAPEKVDALIASFASRALHGRRTAWSLLFEPVDPAVEAERLRFRGSYVALGEAVLREGIAAGELTAQRPDVTAAAMVGAVAEALVGRLTPPAEDAPPVTGSAAAPRDVTDAVRASDAEVVTEIQRFCRRAIGA